MSEIRVLQNKSKEKQYQEFDYQFNTKILDTLETDGLIQMTLKDIFAKINSQTQSQTKVTISYFEVYQEKIYDLLGESSQPLEIRDTSENVPTITGLIKKPIKNIREALDQFSTGEKRRKFA